MDAKGKQASGGVEFAVISPLVFPGLDSKPRIPVGKNFRILAWIDRDRADIQYFRRGDWVNADTETKISGITR